MSDNKAKAKAKESSRRRVTKDVAPADPDREVRMLMKRTGISYSQVLALIHRYGHDRATIERAASRLRPT